MQLSTDDNSVYLDAVENIFREKAGESRCNNRPILHVYNFARVHQTLRVTPAMEVAILDHVWSIEEIVGLGLNMKICVGAFLFQNGLVLLGLRSEGRLFYPGLWDAIGGHVESKESIRDALARELSEEIQVTPIDMFLVTRWKGAGPTIQGNEHSEIGWFSVAEAMTMPLAHPGYVEILSGLQHGG